MRFAMLSEKSIEVDIVFAPTDQPPVELPGAFMACVVRSISLKRPFHDFRHGPPLATRDLMGESARSALRTESCGSGILEPLHLRER